MTQYILGRLVSMVPVMVGVVLAVFIMIKLAPGDPASAILGTQATPAELERVRHALGLDRSWPEQFGMWLAGVTHGDLGASYVNKKPVGELILTRLPVTIELALVATVLAAVVGITAGVVAATRRYSGTDYVVTIVALFGVSMPTFWFGILLILLFSLYLGWLPASGFVPLMSNPIKHFQSLIMPALALGLFLAGALSRFSRSSMVETLAQNYIRTARAKGLGDRVVVWLHALKNSLIPTVTVLGSQFGALLGGAIIVEQVFAYPGVGTLLLTAISQRDYPVVMGVVLVVAALVVLTNLVVDLAYLWLDPRIRYAD
jgi:ABC-type dipeptide/oligopeptide/nickel transport system permease component